MDTATPATDARTAREAAARRRAESVIDAVLAWAHNLDPLARSMDRAKAIDDLTVAFLWAWPNGYEVAVALDRRGWDAVDANLVALLDGVP